MTRQGDAAQEDRLSKRNAALIRAVEFELVNSLQAAGAVLLGFSLRYEEWECLITLRAVVGEEKRICFVGSDTIANALVKCVRDCKANKLHWKEDKYR